MNPNDKLSKFKPQVNLSNKSLGDLIQLATEKQIFGVLSRIGLTEEQKQKLEDASIGEFVQSLSYPQEANFRESLRSILSIDKLKTDEKSWIVKVEGKEYKRTVSEIFAIDKDFKNSIDIVVNNSAEFKSKLIELRKNNEAPLKYILGQDIIDSDSKENLQLNWKIIQAMVGEQYKGSWFKFIKDSGLVILNGNKIAKSELTSYRDGFGNWRYDRLGNYGYIWLRALHSYGDPICILFREDSANWYCGYP